MSDVKITVDGMSVSAESGVTVAAAMIGARIAGFRTSVTGETRGPVCGMGSCYECRVTIDGVAHERACMRVVRQGMVVETRA
jgi:sarcosine oxidase subunit alpha